MFDGEGDAQAQKLGVNSQKAENFEQKKKSKLSSSNTRIKIYKERERNVSLLEYKHWWHLVPNFCFSIIYNFVIP